MTNREFLFAMKSILLCDEKEVPSADELLAKADEMIASIDKQNANRKPSKDSMEASARRDIIRLYFNDETVEADREEIASLFSMSPSQATSALTYLVKEGYLKKEKKKVGKKEKTFYSLA